MSHATGIGYVAKRDGDYSDAIVNKKLKVHMLLMETLGGISPGGVSYLGKLAGLADPRPTDPGTAPPMFAGVPLHSWPIMACACPPHLCTPMHSS